jgi:hypothetical protein
MPKIPRIEIPGRAVDMVNVPAPTMEGVQALSRGRAAISQGISQLAQAYGSYEEKRNRLDTNQYINETNLQLDIWEKETAKNNTIKFAGKNPDGLADTSLQEFDSLYDRAIGNARTDTARDVLERERDYARNKVLYKFKSQQDRMSNSFGLKTLMDNREKRIESYFNNPDPREAMRGMLETDVEIMQANGLLLDDAKRAALQTAHKDFAKSYLDGALSLGKVNLDVAKDFLTNEKHPQKLLADKLDTSEKLAYLKKIETLQKLEKEEVYKGQRQNFDLIVKDVMAGGAVFNKSSQRNKTIEMIRSGLESDDERVVQKADTANAYMRLAEVEDAYLLTGQVDDAAAIRDLPPIKTPIGEVIVQNTEQKIKADVEKKLVTKGADYLYTKDAQTRKLTNSVMSGAPNSFEQLRSRADVIYDIHNVPVGQRKYIPSNIKAMYENPLNKAKSENNPQALVDVVDKYSTAFGEYSHKLAKELKIDEDVRPLFFVDDRRKLELAQFIVSDFKPNNADLNMSIDNFYKSDLSEIHSYMGGTTNISATTANKQKMARLGAMLSLDGDRGRQKAEDLLSSRFRPLSNSRAKVFVDVEDPLAVESENIINRFFKAQNMVDLLQIKQPNNGYTPEQFNDHIKSNTMLVSNFDYSTYMLVYKSTLNPVTDVKGKIIYMDLREINELNQIDESKKKSGGL